MNHRGRMRIAPVIFMLGLLALRAVSSVPVEITGRVVGVHDGDTITVLTDEKEQLKVRLEGIDAPELKQAFGSVAKRELSALVFGKMIAIKSAGHDRYKRTLGRITCEGLDVNLEMVRRGYTWHYLKYSKERALSVAEHEAR